MSGGLARCGVAQRAMGLMLAVGLALPGCSRDEAKPAAPAAPVAEKRPAVENADSTSKDSPVGSAPSAHPLAAGWARAVPPEPHPEARGLYRRAIERVHAGAANDAAPLFERLRADFGDTRFAARLKGGGDPAATAALLGLAATVGAATFVGAARSLGRPRPAPATP